MIGVAELDLLPGDSELPPPNTRCCFGCGRKLGNRYISFAIADGQWVKMPFCWRCTRISRGAVEWSSLRDDVERRFADRCIEWSERTMRSLGFPLNPGASGIYRGVWGVD